MAKKMDPKTEVTAELSLREQLLGRLSEEGNTGGRREVSVMTRMSGESVEVLDALVELNIFSSRSEAVSAFVAQVISTRKGMFDEIKKQAAEIRKLRDSAKKHAFEALREESV
jgi:Arc/MetJ-type ribon-helix-helix transcriptional regulator